MTTVTRRPEHVRQISLDLIDPNPNQPKSRLKFSGTRFDSLVESMRSLGQLAPIIVVENGDRFVTIAGHRRTAGAKKLAWETVAAIVFPQGTEVTQLKALIAENTQREDMTAVEESQTIQTALKLGATKDEVAKATGRTAQQIEATKAVAKAPKAIVEATAQASLEEAEALVEFATDDKAIEKLTEVVGSGRFPHVLEALRQERDRARKVNEAHIKLQADNTRILEHNQTWYFPAKRLDELKIKPRDHVDCKGHGAVVNNSGEIVYWCTDCRLHGVKGHVAGERQEKTEEQKEAERAKRQSRAAHRAATTVRLTFITGTLKTKRDKVDSKIAKWCLDYAWRHGVTSPGSAAGAQATAIAGEKPSSPLNGLLAQAIADFEKRLEQENKNHGMTVSFSDYISSGKWSVKPVLAYFEVLQSEGYTLSEAEEAFVALCRLKAGDEK